MYGDRVYRVLVVDDRAVPRAGAKAMIEHLTDLTFIGDASSGEEAVQAVSRLRPDVVLMDVDMSGMDGAEATRLILRDRPDLTVVAWTVSDMSEDLVRMMRAGCAGYVLKDVGPDELRNAILAAVRRDLPIPRRMIGEVLRRAVSMPAPPAVAAVPLTDREKEALRLLAEGRALKQMAAEMGVAISSADTHVRNLYRKLGVNNRAEAVAAGYKSGLLNFADN